VKILSNLYLWVNDKFTAEPQSLLVEKGIIIEHLPYPVPEQYKHIYQQDFNRAYAYPGFIDTHTHSFEGGLYSSGADLSKAQNIDEVLQLLSAENAKKSKNEIIFAWQLDETLLQEKRFPAVQELDSAVPDKPLLLRRIDGHSCILNSFARKQIKDLDTSREILRGAENDYAVHYFHNCLADDIILEAYQVSAKLGLQAGFSCLHTMIGDAHNSITHYELIRDNLDKFPLRFILYPQSYNIKAVLNAGAKRIGGCILADGSIGSETAAISEPYLNSTSHGILYQSNEFWQKFISEASKHNLQVAVHCIGDRAIRQINNVYKTISATEELRHELIHCELTDDELIQEIAISKAAPVMQPNFDLLWGGENGFYAKKLGIKRSSIMNRFASLLKAGITVTGGSDWYVTPLNAAQSINAAVHHHNPQERLTLAQAIDIYTKNAAWLNFEEDTWGQIKNGFQADLSIYSFPLGTETSQLLYIIREGEIKYATK
jgi:predicted amidohydrolase YtcJ